MSSGSRSPLLILSADGFDLFKLMEGQKLFFKLEVIN